MAKTRTYKVGNDVYDIPENETKDFLSNFSDAIEVESFIVDKDTFDIPLAEIQEFKTQFPTAQPLKKKASTEPIQPDLGSGGTVGASGVQSTESKKIPSPVSLIAQMQEKAIKDSGEQTKQEIKASNLTPVELRTISDRLVQSVNTAKQKQFPLEIPDPELKTKAIPQPKDELLSKFNQDAIAGVEDNVKLILKEDPKLQDKTRKGFLSDAEQFEIVEKAISRNMINANNGIDILNARGINKIIESYAKDTEEVNKIGSELNIMASEMETLKKDNKINEFNKLVPQYNEKIKQYQQQSKSIEKYKEYEPQIKEYYGYIEQYNNGLKQLTEAKSKYPTLELAEKAQKVANTEFYESTFGKALDLGATATNSIVDAFKGLFTSGASIAADIGETLDPSLRKQYKPSDAFVDFMDRTITKPFLTKESIDSKFINPNTGNINWGVYPALKSVANNVGFTTMLALTGRATTPILTRQFAASAPTLTASLNAANKAKVWTTVLPAYMGVYTQNSKEADEMGLTGAKKLAYVNIISGLEGVSELIMPDQDLIMPNLKQRLLKDFVKDYAKGKTFAVKNLVLGIAENAGKEQIEELMVMAGKNLTTAVYNIADGETKVYVPTVGEFVETMMVAGVMAGAMTVPTKLIENAQFRKVALYKMATNYEASKAILDQINPSNKQQILEEMQVFQTQIGKLPNDVSDIKKAEIALRLNEISEINKQNENPELSDTIKKVNEKRVSELEKEIYGIITDKEYDARYAEEMNKLATETISEDPITIEEDAETDGTDAKVTELENELKELVSGTTTTPTVSEPIQPTETTPQEQGVEETVSESVSEVGDGATETATTVLDPLKDVESTQQALYNLYSIKDFEEAKQNVSDLFNLINKKDRKKIETKLEKSFDSQRVIAEAYHKAKVDGSNPELVKAVEELLTPKIEQDAKEQQSGQMREQSVQETTERTSDSDMPIINEAELQDREVVEEEVTQEEIDLQQEKETQYLLNGEAQKRRSAGKFIKDGIEYVRNKVNKGIRGNKGVVKFAEGVPDMPFTYKLVEAEELQPSHSQGYRNPMHFIPEAQPKNRNDEGSKSAEMGFANEPRFKELGENTNAYSGAPVVNERSEVVQGNNRAAGLKIGYNQGNSKYKNDLADNAEKFGFSKEQVLEMKNPILVREVAFSDEGAIEFGNYDAKDLETGGKGRIDPIALVKRIPIKAKAQLTALLFKDDLTLNNAIRNNEKEVLGILTPYLNTSQRTTLIKDGELSARGVQDIEAVVQQFLFDNGDMALPDLFENLSHKQKEGIRKSLPFIFSAGIDANLIPEIQNAILALNQYDSSGIRLFDSWLTQADAFTDNKSPKEIYTPQEIAIARVLNDAKSQIEIVNKFKEFSAAVEGVAEKPATLLDEATPAIKGKTKEQALNEIFKIKKDEGQQEGDKRSSKKADKKTPTKEQSPEEIAKRIRDKKNKGSLSAIDFGISVTVYNGALEFMAKQVEKGTKLGNAIANTIKWIDGQMQGVKWNKGAFAKYMNDTYTMKLNDGRTVEVVRDDTKQTAQVINGWYQPIEQKVLDTKQETQPANKWAEQLRSKEDEDLWTGVREYLESKGAQSVSKKELLDFMKDNRVEIVEVVKGQGSQLDKFDIKFDKDDYVVTRNGIEERRFSSGVLANDYIRKQEVEDTTKFSQYQLEGDKENYKEVLVTLPKKKTPPDSNVTIKSREELLSDKNNYTATEDNGYFVIRGLRGAKKSIKKDYFTPTKEKAIEQYIQDELSYQRGDTFDVFNNKGEYVETVLAPNKERAKEIYIGRNTVEEKTKFKSTHFDEPNILVHLRMNTRTDADGKKVLFLEEIQSDWGQKGKKEGFQIKIPTDNEIAKSKYGKPYSELSEEQQITIDREVAKMVQQGEIPSAPFVTSTPSWVKLGIKTAIKEAVAQGATKIAWTTGEQQNDRYDLSKVIENITVTNDGLHKDGYTIYKVKSEYKSGEETFGYYRAEELPNVLGKDLADKILADNLQKGEKEIYEGVDLKVGGKGMKGFYGSPTEGTLGIVGNVAKSLFKQEPKTVSLGGKKGSITRTQALSLVNDGKRVFTELRGEEYPLNTVGDVMEANNYYVKDSESSVQSTQHSIDITPELKASVEQGLPLFGTKSLLDRLEDLKIKGGDQTGALMLAPKLFNGFIDAIKAGVKAGMILGDAIKKGIDYLKANGVTDVEPYLNEIEINAKEPNLKREIQKLIKRKPTEQKRIDKAYALGVADTKETFKAKLDEMKSDFKEFLGFQAEQTKQAVQAEKAKGESKLSQERYMKKQITDLIKSALDKDFISQRTFETIMNRLGKAKTPNQYQKLFDYISKAAEQADYAERMSEVSKLQSIAKKRNHTSMQKVVNDFVAINPELIPDNLLPQYIQALDELSGRVPSYTTMMDIYYQVMAAKPTPKKFENVTTYNQAKELYDSIALNKVSSIEDYRSLFADINSFKRKINQLIENEIDLNIIQSYEDLLEQVGKDQQAVESKYASEITSLKTDMINELRKSMNSTGITNLSTPDKALLSRFFDLTNNDLRNLSPEELYNLQSIMDNVREDGYLDVFRLNPLVIKAENVAKAKEVSAQINKAKPFAKQFDDMTQTLKRLGATYSAFWESVLGLGSVNFGAFTKQIVVPMERAIAAYRRNVNDGYKEYNNLKSKYGIKNDMPFGIKKALMDKVGKETNQMTKLGMVSAYLREYAMQFDPNFTGKKDADGNAFGTRDWFQFILSSENAANKFTKDELTRIREVWDAFPKVNGKVDLKAVYDSYMNNTTEFLTKNEMSFIKDLNKWKEENITNKQKYSNELRGKGFNEVLFHIKRIRKGETVGMQNPIEISERGNMRIAAGSGKDVTNNNMGAIEVDFEKIFAKSVEETARDFNITPMLQQQSDLLSRAEKEVKEGNKTYIEVARENLRDAINYEFERTKSEFLEGWMRNLMKAKAAQVLIAPIRSVGELLSSLVSYPLRSKEFGSYKEMFKKRDAVRKLMEITQSPFLNKTDISKHFDVQDGEIKGKDKFSAAIEFFAAMPERLGLEPVWMASFTSDFLKQTGVEFDRKQFISDPSYAKKYKTQIENSAAAADANYSQIAGSTTQAGSRRFIKVAPERVAKALGVEEIKANTIGGQILSFFTNYPFREVEQGVKAARALVEVAGTKEYDYKDGLKVLMPVVGSFLGALTYQYSQAISYNLKQALLGDDDEKERADEELKKLLSDEGILNESIAAVSSVGSTRYSGLSKFFIQTIGTIVYNTSKDEKVKDKAKALTRDITFKNPFELKKKKDGEVSTYGLKEKIAFEVMGYIPPLASAGDALYKWAVSLGGYEYIYKKIEKGELLTEPEKELLIATQLFINTANIIIMNSGGAIPFSNELNKYINKVKKEKSTTQQGSTLGRVIETTDRQATERQTNERQATSRQAE